MNKTPPLLMRIEFKSFHFCYYLLKEKIHFPQTLRKRKVLLIGSKFVKDSVKDKNSF